MDKEKIDRLNKALDKICKKEKVSLGIRPVITVQGTISAVAEWRKKEEKKEE